MTEATHEAKARRSVIERVISGLSEHGVDMQSAGSGGGIPEYTQSDYAAALGQMPDPFASCLFWGGYMRYAKARNNLVDRLHHWGWNRWAEKGREGKIDTLLHCRMSAMAVYEKVDRPLAYDESIKALSVGRDRWRYLRVHYTDLQSRLDEAESTLSRHLMRRLRDSAK